MRPSRATRAGPGPGRMSRHRFNARCRTAVSVRVRAFAQPSTSPFSVFSDRSTRCATEGRSRRRWRRGAPCLLRKVLRLILCSTLHEVSLQISRPAWPTGPRGRVLRYVRSRSRSCRPRRSDSTVSRWQDFSGSRHRRLVRRRRRRPGTSVRWRCG